MELALHTTQRKRGHDVKVGEWARNQGYGVAISNR